MMKKNLFYMLAASVMLSALAFVVSCTSMDDNVVIIDPSKPDTEVTEHFNGLDYLRAFFLQKDDKGNITSRPYGVVLDEGKPSEVAVGVKNIEEARKLFRSWIAPGQFDNLTENNGTVTFAPTDKEGRPLGLLTFAPTSDGNALAAIDFSKEAGTDELNRIVFINHNLMSTNDGSTGNLNEDFLRNWESQTEVAINRSDHSEGTELVSLPWASAKNSKIPSQVSYDVKKADGWEMAFSVLGDNSLKNSNYFALYNRDMGILRSFLYVNEASWGSSNFSFGLQLGDHNADMQYPFYSSLGFAIPTNHTQRDTTLNVSVNLNNMPNANSIWQSYYSPISNGLTSSLSIGWWCFDVDLSAYNPYADTWRNGHDSKLTYDVYTEQNSTISLTGTITAALSGNFDMWPSTSSSAKGGSSLASSLLSLFGGTWNNMPTQQLFGMFFGKDGSLSGTGFAKAKTWLWVGTLASVAGSLIGLFDTGSSTPAPPDTIHGKISMDFNGQLDLSGYSVTPISNSVAALSLEGSTLCEDSHVGEGIWSLAEDPVMYVPQAEKMVDSLIFDPDRSNYFEMISSDKTDSDIHWFSSKVSEDVARSMAPLAFLDPTTLKVNINTKRFPDISDVELYYTWGVYPDNEPGAFQSYRKMLGFSQRTASVGRAGEDWGQISPIDDNKFLDLYVALAVYNDEDQRWIDMSTLLSSEFEEGQTEGATTGYYDVQKGPEVTIDGENHGKPTYRYYGEVADIGGRKFISQPVCFFPYLKPIEEDGYYHVGDMNLDDFVVVVILKFNSGGRSYTYSQRYLPRIRHTTSQHTMREVYRKLREYQDEQTEGKKYTLNNDPNIPVAHPVGLPHINKTLQLLEKYADKNDKYEWYPLHNIDKVWEDSETVFDVTREEMINWWDSEEEKD